MQKISKVIATLFFVGYIPFAPGTAASLIGAFFYVLAGRNTPVYFALTLFFVAAGFWAVQKSKGCFTKKDPPEIVIDELASMMLAYLFIPVSLKFLLAGFFLFRLFDILKTPPIKKLESLPGGYGIMLDDIAAAIITNLILQVARSSGFLGA